MNAKKLDQTTVYFAYGSNMRTERLRRRVPSATLIGQARLPQKRLVFNKRSKDGSGKANLVDSPGDAVWGVLFQIDCADLDTLDRAEAGYERTSLAAWTPEGTAVPAEVYRSAELTSNPVPYDWYKNLVVGGAREHELPEEYLRYLDSLPSKPDPQKGEAV